MGLYKRILFAADLLPDEKEIADRAVAIANALSSELSIAHVVEEPYNYGFAFETQTVFEWQEETSLAAKRLLNEMGRNMNIPEERRILKRGNAKHGILEAAIEVQADLIIVGCHSRSGLSMMLGSTADGVLHRADCDVLVLRIKKPTTHV